MRRIEEAIFRWPFPQRLDRHTARRRPAAAPARLDDDRRIVGACRSARASFGLTDG